MLPLDECLRRLGKHKITCVGKQLMPEGQMVVLARIAEAPMFPYAGATHPFFLDSDAMDAPVPVEVAASIQRRFKLPEDVFSSQ
jgi:hypothetical protein